MSRTIDADALTVSISKYSFYHENDRDMVCEIIRVQPTIEPERKKGKWLIDRGLYKCSYCNQLWAEWWAVSKSIERMNKEMPYCPICGSYNRWEEGDQ